MGKPRLPAFAAATALALIGMTQPLVVSAASQPLNGAVHTRSLLARAAPGSLTALPKPNQRGRLGIGAALVAGIGPNIQVSPVDRDHYSTTASTYDPTNHSNLFAGSNILTSTPVAGFLSADSGSSWTTSAVPFPTAGPASFGFYPGAAFNADGILYASFMAYSLSGTTLSTQIAVSTSLDRGKTWTTPNVVEPPATNPEKPLIAVDTTSSPYRNRIYVGYDSNPARGSEPLVVSHSDDGVTWTRTTLGDTGGDFGAAPAVGPNGETYVAWDDWCASNGTSCTSPGHILLAKSTDGGMSWSSNGPVATTSIGFEATLPNYSNGCSNPPVNPNPAPSIDVDRSGGVHNGSVYVAWGDQPSGGRMHIFYARSTDGGAHFSTPIQIDTGNTNDAWQPAVSVDQSNGAVAIAWYDRRDDGGRNLLYRPYYTQSTDGGATFLTTQVPVASSTSDPTLSCLATGDYMQMSAVDGIAHPFWSDTRNGINQIFTATVDEATLAQLQMRPPRLFGPVTSVPAGSTPVAVAVADFNGDGNPDVAVTNGDTMKLSILLGDGKGGFVLGTTYPVGTDPEAIVSGDFNGDGKLDLAVANTGSGTVSIFIGNGDGTFKPAVSYPAGSGDYGLAVADLNNDGKLDLVTANYSDSSVSVLIGNGDGTFKTAVQYATGYATFRVAIGDFNHDGHPDLAVAVGIPGGVANVAVLINNGDGTFKTAVKYNADDAYTLVVGDFSGNGNLDLAVAGSTISVFMGNGDGTFQAAKHYPYPGQAHSMLAIDVNGDGKLDLALAGFDIMLGAGDGSFAAAETYNANSRTVAVADLNRDGQLDLIGANTGANSISVVLGIVPRMTPSPSTLSFPAVPAKSVGALQSINVTNSGSGELRIALAQVAGVSGQDFAKVGDTCSGATVSAGGSCVVSLRFAPKTVGIKTAALRITDDADGSPQLVPLNGTALIKWPRPETAPPAVPSAGGWSWRNPLPQGNPLSSVSCPSSTTCYAVGGGDIRKTTDGGSTWSGQASGTTSYLNGIACPSAISCFAVGFNGTILATTDGGAHWIAQASGTAFLMSMSCPGATTCFAVAQDGTILTTTDAGATWTAKNSGLSPSDHMFGVSCPTTTSCFAVGTAIVATVDGGMTWVHQGGGLSPSPYLYGVSCPSVNACTAVGYPASIVTTTNAGMTWSSEASSATSDLRGVSCATTGNCLAVGGDDILASTNGGVSWSKQAAPRHGDLWGVSCANPSECIAVGFGGTTLATTDGGANWRAASSGAAYNSQTGVSCPDVSTCYAVGAGTIVNAAIGSVTSYYGTILNSTDGGRTWAIQSGPSTTPLYAISCPTTTTCFTVGYSPTSGVGEILATSDGGKHWWSQASGVNNYLNGISCPTVSTCFAVGRSGVIGTTNGGSTWSTQATNTAGLSGVSCPSPSTCIAVGDVGAILATTNGGGSWAVQTSGATEPLHGVTCVSSSSCLVVGDALTILKTTNGGATWSHQPSVVGIYLSGVSCLDVSTCVAVGYITGRNPQGIILGSTNGGMPWSNQASGTTNALWSVSCPTARNCYAVGDTGTILALSASRVETAPTIIPAGPTNSPAANVPGRLTNAGSTGGPGTASTAAAPPTLSAMQHMRLTVTQPVWLSIELAVLRLFRLLLMY